MGKKSKAKADSKPEFYKFHSELSDLQPNLQKLYGLIEWRCTQEHPPGRERIHDGKWCATHAEIAAQLGLKGKTGHEWVARLLSRLHKLKLINSKRRGPPYGSEYWHLSFPDPVWLSDQVKILGPIQKSKTKDLRQGNMGSNPYTNMGSNPYFPVLSPIPATHSLIETNTERTACASSPLVAVMEQQKRQNGRENGTQKRKPAAVYRDPLGRCTKCGDRGITDGGRWCVCEAGVALYEREFKTKQRGWTQ